MSARSVRRVPRRATRGGASNTRTATPMASGTVVQRYVPANANSAQPAVSSRTCAARRPLDRRFGVVVLVLVAVVARIVVLVAREIDLVQHDGRVLRPRLQNGLDGALGQT